MYSLTKFYDRQVFACSIPPDVSPNLSEGFQELSRIHFYLGRAPIDFMIEAVEKAPLEHIEQGKIQIYFAVKEIENYLQTGGSYANNISPSHYFNETFSKILNHTIEVLDDIYINPTYKQNTSALEAMLQLTQEVKFLKSQLSEVGVKTENISENLFTIEEKCKQVLKLKDSYENLKEIKPLEFYEDSAKASVIEQLKQPYEFTCSELNKIYYDMEDWWHTHCALFEKREEILNNPDYVYDLDSAQELKDTFLKQIKSFNHLLKNGVVNYVHSYAASISKSIFIESQNSKVPSETLYERKLNYLQKNLASPYSYREQDKIKKEIKDLEGNKDEFIKEKNQNKLNYEINLINLNKQEKDIIQTINKVKQNLFGIKLNDTLILEGNIETGFVTGKFSNKDEILLIHRDNLVNSYNAIYSMIVSKEHYQSLIDNNKLEYNETLRSSNYIKGSNFFNYGQFLEEITNSETQKNFLGQVFDLIDNTDKLDRKIEAKRKFF